MLSTILIEMFLSVEEDSSKFIANNVPESPTF
jgi:hypothetical protein